MLRQRRQDIGRVERRSGASAPEPLVAVVVGILAAIVPAVRAGRLDVLRAIAIE